MALADVATNLRIIDERIRQTRDEGALLTVFPECAVTGYCFDSLDEARPYAQTVPGPATDAISRTCAQAGGHAIFGMLEQDGDRIFNAAVLVGPDGVVGSYRKVHLPYLGIDRFTTHGDRPFEVFQIGELSIGMNICYDSAFPEVSRVLAIQGADLIVLPTNWPPGAQCLAANGISVRAMENNVFYLAVNRVGTERGFRFIGQSQICDPSGRHLASASDADEQILYAEIDPAVARDKRCVRVAGKHEIDRMADRRPEFYGDLIRPHQLRSPGR